MSGDALGSGALTQMRVGDEAIQEITRLSRLSGVISWW